MKEILKELLKPPISFDSVTGHISSDKNIICELVVTKKRHDIGMFIAEALCDKYEIECESPMQWEKAWVDEYDFFLKCSKCNRSIVSFPGNDDVYKYCPSCGQRLLPPKESE